jgi:predicted enzyme related to lactoylglutathione lyase
VTALISHTTFDATDAYAQSVFWSQVLGFAHDPENPDRPGDEECMIFSPDRSQRILFIEVPEQKQVKNRIHLDLVPASGTRDEELARLPGLGATVVDDLRRPEGPGWVVLADPEGNEFCILRSEAERTASAAAGRWTTGTARDAIHTGQ